MNSSLHGYYKFNNFYQTHANKTSGVQDGSEPLILNMIRATRDYYHYYTCLVHQTKAQSNHCVVAKSEMCSSRLDLQCADYHKCNEIMVNVPL
jgi:hypothetical protein